MTQHVSVVVVTQCVLDLHSSGGLGVYLFSLSHPHSLELVIDFSSASPLIT